MANLLLFIVIGTFTVRVLEDIGEEAIADLCRCIVFLSFFLVLVQVQVQLWCGRSQARLVPEALLDGFEGRKLYRFRADLLDCVIAFGCLIILIQTLTILLRSAAVIICVSLVWDPKDGRFFDLLLIGSEMILEAWSFRYFARQGFLIHLAIA